MKRFTQYLGNRKPVPMCLIIFAYKAHPKYDLVLAANRDEYYSRPTLPLGFWKDMPDILAGRDLKEKGTWLGMHRGGRIAAVTNYREPLAARPLAPSRGRLVTEFLSRGAVPETHLENLMRCAGHYNGFNLLAGDRNGLFYCSNRSEGVHSVNPGIHGISNHLMNTPWPKVIRAKKRLERIVKVRGTIDPEDIFQMLIDTGTPPDERLPDTGIGLSWERVLSPIFIKSPTYGTRSSSVILRESSGALLFTERTFILGAPFKTLSFEILPEVPKRPEPPNHEPVR
jgi:uncharacterized protein with NRDE domain